jgi:hypothetical protein
MGKMFDWLHVILDHGWLPWTIANLSSRQQKMSAGIRRYIAISFLAEMESDLDEGQSVLANSHLHKNPRRRQYADCLDGQAGRLMIWHTDYILILIPEQIRHHKIMLTIWLLGYCHEVLCTTSTRLVLTLCPLIESRQQMSSNLHTSAKYIMWFPSTISLHIIWNIKLLEKV